MSDGIAASSAAGASPAAQGRLSRCASDADERRLVAAADEAALGRISGGDTEAYSELVRRYQDKVYSIACGFVGPGDDALDLTQDVFVKAYAELRRFRGRAAFYTWLYRIAINTCIDRVRRAGRERWVAIDEVDPACAPEIDDPARVLEMKELTQAVQRAIAQLSPKLRAVMVLHDVVGLEMDEVVRLVGCRPATARTRLFRARAQVRDGVRRREEWRGNEVQAD